MKINYTNDIDFQFLVKDIAQHPEYQRLRDLFHHEHSIYDHCMCVAWLSFKIARTLKLRVKDIVRGALLHDFYFYSWRDKNRRPKSHAYNHPRTAYENAVNYFGPLTKVESDIILKHMWPFTVVPPKYLESSIVSLIDKIVAIKGLGVEITRKTVKRLRQ